MLPFRLNSEFVRLPQTVWKLGLLVKGEKNQSANAKNIAKVNVLES